MTFDFHDLAPNSPLVQAFWVTRSCGQVLFPFKTCRWCPINLEPREKSWESDRPGLMHTTSCPPGVDFVEGMKFAGLYP